MARASAAGLISRGEINTRARGAVNQDDLADFIRVSRACAVLCIFNLWCLINGVVVPF